MGEVAPRAQLRPRRPGPRRCAVACIGYEDFARAPEATIERAIGALRFTAAPAAASAPQDHRHRQAARRAKPSARHIGTGGAMRSRLRRCARTERGPLPARAAHERRHGPRPALLDHALPLVERGDLAGAACLDGIPAAGAPCAIWSDLLRRGPRRPLSPRAATALLAFALTRRTRTRAATALATDTCRRDLIRLRRPRAFRSAAAGLRRPALLPQPAGAGAGVSGRGAPRRSHLSAHPAVARAGADLSRAPRRRFERYRDRPRIGGAHWFLSPSAAPRRRFNRVARLRELRRRACRRRRRRLPFAPAQELDDLGEIDGAWRRWCGPARPSAARGSTRRGHPAAGGRAAGDARWQRRRRGRSRADLHCRDAARHHAVEQRSMSSAQCRASANVRLHLRHAPRRDHPRAA